jgi:hypothetical protein
VKPAAACDALDVDIVALPALLVFYTERADR